MRRTANPAGSSPARLRVRIPSVAKADPRGARRSARRMRRAEAAAAAASSKGKARGKKRPDFSPQPMGHSHTPEKNAIPMKDGRLLCPPFHPASFSIHFSFFLPRRSAVGPERRTGKGTDFAPSSAEGRSPPPRPQPPPPLKKINKEIPL